MPRLLLAPGRRGAFVALVVCTHVACSLDLSGYAGDRLGPSNASNDGQAPFDDAGVPDTYVPGVDAADPNAVYGALVERDRPVAFFRFDDKPDAGAAVDSIGAHDALCTKSGIVFGAKGFRGGAVTLDGSSDSFMDMGDVFSFAGLVPFSLEVWVKPKAGTFQGVLMKKRDQADSNNFKGWVFYMSGGDRSVHFEGWGAGISAWTNGTIDAPLSATGFTHAAVVVSYEKGVGNAAVYIDGARNGVGGFDNTTALPATNVGLELARDFAGTLDELAIYDYALSPSQIVAHFTAGRQ